MVDWWHLLLGLPVLLAPGFALTWALAPGLDWPKRIAASVIVSLTFPPATTYVLSVFFGVPITPMNTVLTFLLWAFLGVAWAARLPLDRAFEA